MKDYKSLLGENEIEDLRRIIGQEISGIYTKMIDIDLLKNRYISYFGYNIRFGKDSFLIIKNLWKETNLYTDYWGLNVEFSHEPIYIDFNKERCVIENAPVNIAVRSRVSNIEIYSYFTTELLDNDESETITYDSAIIFCLNDNRRICFAPQKNIADGVWLTLDEKQISDYLEESVLRMRFIENLEIHA